ncbi:unnamed protein product [Nesidiocoris tenuis]|uniref:Uncharacterized protein n=1 Tax=Nesidiocoris tenuis TaxID=355587 RepID=A0A6H5GRS7_9HEMI|nr:unnamed protein product [Nesidiocoris tenuis]
MGKDFTLNGNTEKALGKWQVPNPNDKNSKETKMKSGSHALTLQLCDDTANYHYQLSPIGALSRSTLAPRQQRPPLNGLI